MRRILATVLEVAMEIHKGQDQRQSEVRELWGAFDDYLSGNASRPAKVEEALVTADFPYYFGRTISAAVEARYNYQQGAWRDYTKATTVPNFLTGVRYRFDEFDRLVKRREKQEARAGSVAEHRWLLAVDLFAKQIDLSYRVLVNDDLGAFNDIPVKLGDSARRFEDWWVSALYDNALSQAAMVALGAAYSGTGRLTTNNLAIAYNAFLTRVDAKGQPLNIPPRYIVGPPILGLVANQILQSERIAELATNSINPLRNALTFKADPYMAFAAPNVPWYLAADPNDVAAITVARMDGHPGPEVFAKAPDKVPMSAGGGLGTADWRQGSFVTGNIEIMVETIIGARNDAPAGLVGVSDPNGWYYSSGTTP